MNSDKWKKKPEFWNEKIFIIDNNNKMLLSIDLTYWNSEFYVTQTRGKELWGKSLDLITIS